MTSSRQSPQLEAWRGNFGDDWIERNDLAPWKVACATRAFDQILGAVRPRSVLEVGSATGINLVALRQLLGEEVELYAVEPNASALARLHSNPHLNIAGSWDAAAQSLPLGDAAVDLAFTAGVLIHIAEQDLGNAVDELVRVSRRYVLCIEYFSHEPTEVPYRGNSALLFKRDFGSYIADRHPELAIMDYGFLWQRDNKLFDDLHWFLFTKDAGQAGLDAERPDL